jgi:hypothetical protein
MDEIVGAAARAFASPGPAPQLEIDATPGPLPVTVPRGLGPFRPAELARFFGPGVAAVSGLLRALDRLLFALADHR